MFGKRVECYKWIIAAHITNGSVDVYEALASKWKNDNYIELKHPIRDYIESDGRIWLDVKCKQPWRLCQGNEMFHLIPRRFGEVIHILLATTNLK